MVETDFSPEWVERIGKANELTAAGADRLKQYFPEWSIQPEPSATNPAEALLEKARQWPADLIVVGTHGRSALGRMVLGSVSLKLIREAPCSVRVARQTPHDHPLRLLIGMDGSPEADAALAEVCRRQWPKGTQARVVAVHEVFSAVSEERIAIGEQLYNQINEDEHLRLRHSAATAAERLSEAGLAAAFVIEEGDPKDVLLRQAREWPADGVFVGARGLGRLESLLLGSVSSTTVSHAPCTVEVVRLR
jgi:nucleotide-binding universal stress UspA family protein